MRVLLLFFLAAMALALPSPQHRIAPKVVYVPIGHPSKHFYTVNVTMGTPPQSASLFLDTGSPLTWTNDKDALCLPGSSPSGCANSHAFFDPAQSDSYTLLNQSGFQALYGDGAQVQGDYFTDSFRIGSLPSNLGHKPFVVENLTIGLTKKESYYPKGYGMIGLSLKYPANYSGKVEVVPGDTQILDVMKQQGIRTRSFSLSLGHNDASSGSLVFGGYDPAKYEGPLTVLPMEQNPLWGTYTGYNVNVSSVAFTDSRGTTKKITSDTFNSVALLDSGSELTDLSENIFKAVLKATGAHELEEGANTFHKVCDKIPVGSMDFEFGGLGESSRISVKLSELFAPDEDLEADGSRLCRLMATDDADDGTLGLNQSFLRSAYVVHHLDEKVMGIAQAKNVDQGVGSLENVVEIKPGDSMWRRKE
ncbi:hypothetical protein B0A55_05189 [Friedmanniomyces simplex]|uniref:Peptidase A1 domain-containing protein n=1 Tax=Friedmanniomyces simplex TaxID=329884 RepID=A0A4U0XLZ5_9PEZI|nr:hypothetical protein B0A55_05189 [Friedmanniomyces simplex]